MPQFTNAKLLTDGDGNPIPQKYDPATDSFVPDEPGTQLTGSIVKEIDKQLTGASDIAIPPSSYFETDVFDATDIRDISVGTWMAASFDYSVRYFYILSNGGDVGSDFLLEAGFYGNKISGKNNILPTSKSKIRINNNDTTTSHSLSYVVYGRR